MGGQAVIEGVMMRSPHSYAVAVRQPSGSLAVTQAYLDRPSERHPWLKYPHFAWIGSAGAGAGAGDARPALLRRAGAGGTASGRLGDSKPKKPTELSGWMLAANVAFSLAFFIVLYKLVPLYLATGITHRYLRTDNNLTFNLLDGTIRIVLFLGFLILISQWKEIQRVFEYHGAEHKVVWAFEKRGPINVATARACTRFHPRCGTSFLLVVMGISMVLYMFLPFHYVLAAIPGADRSAAGDRRHFLRVHPLCREVKGKAVEMGVAARPLASARHHSRARRQPTGNRHQGLGNGHGARAESRRRIDCGVKAVDGIRGGGETSCLPVSRMRYSDLCIILTSLRKSKRSTRG